MLVRLLRLQQELLELEAQLLEKRLVLDYHVVLLHLYYRVR